MCCTHGYSLDLIASGLQRIEHMINTRSSGSILTGGEKLVGKSALDNFDFSRGSFLPPTVISNINVEDELWQEEIFGPVGVVIKFSDEDDVVRQANDTHYGLAAAVFSKNIDRALRVAHRLNAGTAWINCANLTNAQVPFGGYKQSGIGRECGEYALAKYVIFCK